jgi:hypothetical protein
MKLMVIPSHASHGVGLQAYNDERPELCESLTVVQHAPGDYSMEFTTKCLPARYLNYSINCLKCAKCSKLCIWFANLVAS